MLIKINNVDDILPSLKSLNDVGMVYEEKDDGSIVIKLNTQEFKIGENKDMSRLLSSNWPNADTSLSYFIIKKHRIMASGDLQKIDDTNYICNGSFRVYSKIIVSTWDYMGAGQIETSELDYLNEKMLNATIKDDNKTK